MHQYFYSYRNIMTEIKIIVSLLILTTASKHYILTSHVNVP